MAQDGTTLPLKGRGTDDSSQAGLSRTLTISVTRGLDTGRVFTTGAATVVVGRGDTAQVQLRDPTVSQFHVELALCASGVQIRDLQSRNGVWFDGAQIEQGTVPLGATLAIGDSSMRVDAGGLVTPPHETAPSFGRLVGPSSVMRKLAALLTNLARTEISVLLAGATGTGKEEIARAIHAASPRARGPFVVLDCTVLPESLAGSILFGHERGAFTGANQKQIGLFEAADGGVLFIDELGELSPTLQPMLLRALQSREVTPLGATRPRHIDFRVIAATWRDLRGMVNQGRFREDLYYRVAGASISVPSLEERREDIPALVAHFLAQLPTTMSAARAVAEDAMRELCLRSYPGNIRELRTTIERLAQLAPGSVITMAELEMDSLFAGLRARSSREPMTADSPPAPYQPDGGVLPFFKEAKRTAVDEFERYYLGLLLSRVGSNLTRAAALAGLERHNLRALLRKHDLYRGE